MVGALIVYVLFETRWHLLSELCNRGDTILYHGGLQTREALGKDGRVVKTKLINFGSISMQSAQRFILKLFLQRKVSI